MNTSLSPTPPSPAGKLLTIGELLERPVIDSVARYLASRKHDLVTCWETFANDIRIEMWHDETWVKSCPRRRGELPRTDAFLREVARRRGLNILRTLALHKVRYRTNCDLTVYLDDEIDTRCDRIDFDGIAQSFCEFFDFLPKLGPVELLVIAMRFPIPALDEQLGITRLAASVDRNVAGEVILDQSEVDTQGTNSRSMPSPVEHVGNEDALERFDGGDQSDDDDDGGDANNDTTDDMGDRSDDVKVNLLDALAQVENVTDKQRATAMRAVLGDLPAKQVKYAEIAQMLEMPEDTVKSKLYRALEKLRSWYQEKNSEKDLS